MRLIVIVFWLFANSYAIAEPVILSANEIQKLLVGNTAKGLWQGGAYRQFFNKDGSTIYAPQRAQSVLGKWRVNPSNDRYESWWQFSGWESYRVVRDDGNLFWLDDEDAKQLFIVLPGQQLIWTTGSNE